MAKEGRITAKGKEVYARPLFRWAGGKQRLARQLASFLPRDMTDVRYVEPFFGAGSLFFQVRPRKATLADLNPHLMQAYIQVRDNPLAVHRCLSSHRGLNSKCHYYRTRELYNWCSNSSAAQAARFIYLNRTCYNGVFRVNLADEFNVPYGRKDQPTFPGNHELLAVSRALRCARLRRRCFRTTLSELDSHSFVYLDPPYPPLNGTAFFRHYTRNRFGDSDQRELAEMVRELDEAGIRFMMSNADTQLTKKLYSRFHITLLDVTRSVSCKTVKHQVGELVITNY